MTDTKPIYDAAMKDLEIDGVYNDVVEAICAHVAALTRENAMLRERLRRANVEAVNAEGPNE